MLTRDGHGESFHHGVVSVVDGSGAILEEVGDAERVVYPRSTIKPLQTLAVLKTGVELTDQEVALATASHAGSVEHREAVADFLRRHFLSADLLQCPADWPLSSVHKAELMASGGEKSPLAMNCSGKHAGFLAACQHSGDSLEDYLNATHRLQIHIQNVIETWTGQPVAYTSVDGCGAPLHAITLRGLAQALARMLTSDDTDAQKVVRAVAAHPWAIAGAGQANTRVIETLGGIAKIGAEGLVVIALPSGVTAAVKILDGSMRATTAVALEALQRVGAVSRDIVENLRAELDEPVWGGGAIRGGLRVVNRHEQR